MYSINLLDFELFHFADQILCLKINLEHPIQILLMLSKTQIFVIFVLRIFTGLGLLISNIIIKKFLNKLIVYNLVFEL